MRCLYLIRKMGQEICFVAVFLYFCSPVTLWKELRKQSESYNRRNIELKTKPEVVR